MSAALADVAAEVDFARTWHLHSACRGSTDTFVPDNRATRSLGEEMRQLAVRYCRDCPVIQMCADEADRTASVGLWAGVYRYQGCAGRWRRMFPGAPTPVGGTEVGR